MSISIAELPSASHAVQVRISKEEERMGQFRLKAERYEQQTVELCEKYKEYLLSCIKYSIEKWRTGEWVLVRADLEYLLKSGNRTCKAHLVHYGNFISATSGWRYRKPFLAGRNPFRELQTELFVKKGWILLDESNPAKGFGTYIRLYTSKPEHYENSPVLWHGLNKLPDTLKTLPMDVTMDISMDSSPQATRDEQSSVPLSQ